MCRGQTVGRTKEGRVGGGSHERQATAGRTIRLTGAGAKKRFDARDARAGRRMRREDPLVSTASDCTRITRSNVSECARKLAAEAEFDDAFVRIEFGVTPDEVVQSLGDGERRAEHPRKRGECRSNGTRDIRNHSRHSFGAAHRFICDATQPLTNLVEQKYGKTEPLGEREGNRVCSEVVTELVCDDANEFFVVELGEREGTDDEDVSSASEGVQIVAFLHRQQKTSTWCSRCGQNHARRDGEPTFFVAARGSDPEKSHDEESLCERNEHDNRCESGDGNEHRIRDVERKRNDEPDQRHCNQPGWKQRDDGEDRGERSCVDSSLFPPRHATEARHHRVYTE